MSNMYRYKVEMVSELSTLELYAGQYLTNPIKINQPKMNRSNMPMITWCMEHLGPACKKWRLDYDYHFDKWAHYEVYSFTSEEDALMFKLKFAC